MLDYAVLLFEIFQLVCYYHESITDAYFTLRKNRHSSSWHYYFLIQYLFIAFMLFLNSYQFMMGVVPVCNVLIWISCFGFLYKYQKYAFLTPKAVNKFVIDPRTMSLVSYVYLGVQEIIKVHAVSKEDTKFQKFETFWDLSVSEIVEGARYVSGLLVSFLLMVLCFVNINKNDEIKRDKDANSGNETNGDNESEKKVKKSTWENLLEKVCIVVPYTWPKDNNYVKINLIVSIAAVFISNVLGTLSNVAEKNIVDCLNPSGKEDSLIFRWDLLIFIALLNIISSITFQVQYTCWNEVDENVNNELKTQLFSKLHSLSFRWHLEKKSSEVMESMETGCRSAENILRFVLFDMFRTALDIATALLYFTIAFDWWFGCIVIGTLFLHTAVSVYLKEKNEKLREETRKEERKSRGNGLDSLLNFETVKYFGTERYEINCYKETIRRSKESSYKEYLWDNIENQIEMIISETGTFLASLLAMYMVVYGDKLTYGDYMMFTGYVERMMWPFKYLITEYRNLNKSFVDMDEMLALLNEEPEVKDAANAITFVPKDGEIVFDNVSFRYNPDKTILKEISFKVGAGETIAFVGPTGSGKSTILRLLYRFYDVTGGSIRIDNTDIKDMTQESLRASLGIVPQDTVLYHRSIKYNIKYGKMEATDEDIVEAGKLAEIHDTIVSFADQYKSKVGERGMKLSGGEKQRVAIARLILRAPKCILLDEATSSLDTNTERTIQNTLNNVIANRSTIIVAHRLSTIVNADQIYVLKDGKIIENGNHKDLLAIDGIYANMWNQQAPKNSTEDNPTVIENNTLVDI